MISETLRLYRPVWAFSREVAKDTHIGGYPVPRRSIVLLSPWTMQRDPRFFVEPDMFQPER